MSDITEAPFFAGVLFYLSKWYTKTELSLRMSVFYSGSLLSGAFGSILAAGILKGLAGKLGIRLVQIIMNESSIFWDSSLTYCSAWAWLFIIEGAMTIFVSRYQDSYNGSRLNLLTQSRSVYLSFCSCLTSQTPGERSTQKAKL